MRRNLNWISNIRKIIDQEVVWPYASKAFPGRAAILVKLLNLTEDHISAVYEIKGSIKTGYYVPGTRIPIYPEKQLYSITTQRKILNLAWHLPSEVRSNLISNNYYGEVVDVR